ncbi:MAG: DUF2007 domain-containing protein [Firmicutes bacterium]|nr:DUF2007 domain-containing protein [Bacillota bacterium]
MEPLVAVGRYDSIITAELARAKLESFGIRAVLFNKGIAQVYPGAAYAFGGIVLLVREEDALEAAQILKPQDSQEPPAWSPEPAD